MHLQTSAHLQQAKGGGAQELEVLVGRLHHRAVAQAVNKHAANLKYVIKGCDVLFGQLLAALAVTREACRR